MKVALAFWAKWLRRCGLGALALALIAAGLGSGYEWISAQFDGNRYPPPGQMVDVGGFRMHINCMGSGAPPVLFDAGRGELSLEWARVQGEVAKVTKACAYDRAGQGWSEYGGTPRDIERLSSEMAALLDGAGLTGPVILVPHSISGFHHRVFATRYPSRTAGIVFVDVSHEEQWERYDLPRDFEAQADELHKCALFGYIGWNRLTAEPRHRPMYQDEHQAAAESLYSKPSWCRALGDEVAAYGDNLERLKAYRDLGDTPIMVLSALDKAGQFAPEERARRIAIWADLQQKTAAMSSNSRQVITEKSNHHIQVTEPELVIDAVLLLVKEFRERS